MRGECELLIHSRVGVDSRFSRERGLRGVSHDKEPVQAPLSYAGVIEQTSPLLPVHCAIFRQLLDWICLRHSYSGQLRYLPCKGDPR